MVPFWEWRKQQWGKCKNSAFLKVMQIEFRQIDKLANFPGVWSTAKISKWMTWIFCGRCIAFIIRPFILFIAGKMSSDGKGEFTENDEVIVEFILTLTKQKYTSMYGNRQFLRIYNEIRWYLGFFCTNIGIPRLFCLAI